MGLQRQMGFCLYGPNGPHQIVAAGRDKPGRQDGSDMGKRAQLQPLAQIFFPVLFTQIFRRVPVHADFSHTAHKTGLFKLAHQFQGAFCVQSAKGADPSGGGVDQIVYKYGVGGFGILQAGVPGLFREDISFQPGHQLQIHGVAADGILGRMDVKVCHAGNNQAVPPVLHFEGLIFFGKDRIYPPADAVLADCVPPGKDGQLIRRLAV